MKFFIFTSYQIQSWKKKYCNFWKSRFTKENQLYYFRRILRQQQLIQQLIMSHKKNMQKKISLFVVKLLAILQEPVSQGIIQWVSPQAFSIVDSDRLSKIILPKYYKHHNISSFIRQLNIYGFNKHKSLESDHIYSNPNFLKNSKKKLKNIQRRSNLKTQERKGDILTSQLHQIKSDMMKNLHALKNQNEQYRHKNEMIEQQIKKLSQQRKKQVQIITNFFCDFVGNIFNNEQSSTNTYEKQEQLYRNVVETLQQIQSLKDQNIMNNQQRIQKMIVYLNGKKMQLEQKKQNDKIQKLCQQQQYFKKQYNDDLILLQSNQYQNRQQTFQDPLYELDENQFFYFS